MSKTLSVCRSCRESMSRGNSLLSRNILNSIQRYCYRLSSSTFRFPPHTSPTPPTQFEHKKAYTAIAAEVSTQNAIKKDLLPGETASNNTNYVVVDHDKAFLTERGGSRKFFTRDVLRDKLSLIEACLRSGQVKRAEILFQQLQSSYPALVKEHVDVHTYNTFLEAFIDNVNSTPQFRSAFLWFNSMKKFESHARPNLTSYAIMLKGKQRGQLFMNALLLGALLMRKRDMIQLLVKDMEKALNHCAITVEHLFASPVLSDRDVTSIKSILSNQSASHTTSPAPSFNESIEVTTPTLDVIDGTESTAVKSSSSKNLKYVQEALKAVQNWSSDNVFEHQLHLERESSRVELERFLNLNSEVRDVTGMGFLSSDLKRLTRHWHRLMMIEIEKELETINSSNSDGFNSFLILFLRHF